jgi:hypothetical protein
MYRECSTHGREEECIYVSESEEVEEREEWEDKDINVRIILKRIIDKQNAVTWTEFKWLRLENDRLCSLVVRILSYRSRGPDSIPDATRFSEK